MTFHFRILFRINSNNSLPGKRKLIETPKEPFTYTQLKLKIN